LDDDGDVGWRNETENRWWFFVPPVMVGIWVLVTIGSVIAGAVAAGSDPGGAAEAEAAERVRQLLEVIDWLGGIGWLLLFVFYFVVLSSKRASAWWALGAFCCGLNLLLYVGLLFLPTRRYIARAVLSDLQPLLPDRNAGPVTSLLKDSFICDSCDSLLNYGVSECAECGARYRYVDGKPPFIDT
jgi:hypothetical protein